MSDLPTSDKIVGLFATFRENEAEIERMEAQLREKTVAQEKVQKELDLVSKSVTQKEIDHHRLRRALIKAKETANSLEPLLAKEKEAQFMIYTNLVEEEGRAAKMEQDHVENQLDASRELLKESNAYLRQRRSFVDSILTGLQ